MSGRSVLYVDLEKQPKADFLQGHHKLYCRPYNDEIVKRLKKAPKSHGSTGKVDGQGGRWILRRYLPQLLARARKDGVQVKIIGDEGILKLQEQGQIPIHEQQNSVQRQISKASKDDGYDGGSNSIEGRSHSAHSNQQEVQADKIHTVKDQPSILVLSSEDESAVTSRKRRMDAVQRALDEEDVRHKQRVKTILADL